MDTKLASGAIVAADGGILSRLCCIESLEARIAPASLAGSPSADHDKSSLHYAQLAASPAVVAPTIYVTTLSDSGAPHSLPWAITQAEASPGSTIKFGSAREALRGTITLTSPLPAITSDMTIDAPGITINGAGKFQDLAITGGDSVTITGLKITNGFASLGAGLYINDSGATITLNGCVITGNHAVGVPGAGNSGSSAQGGGIANMGGSLMIEGKSQVTNNSATGGAGATGGYYGGGAAGGGIFNADALTIVSSKVSGNTAQGGNGGAAVDYSYSASTQTITAATAGGNGGSAYGGGIANAGGAVVIQKSVVSGNAAKGGLGAQGGKTSAGVNGYAFFVQNGSTYGPGAGTDGGNGYNGGTGGSAVGSGIASKTSGGVTLTASTVSGNTATAGHGGNGSAGGNGGNGGKGGTYNGNTYAVGMGGNGGNGGIGGNGGLAAGAGIYCFGSALTVHTSTISGNAAHAGKAGALGAAGTGGSGYQGGGSAGTAGQNGTYYGGRGGGIDSEQSSLMLSLVTIAKNTALNGGGVSIYQDSSASIHNSTIAFNTALPTGTGGGLFITLDASNDPVNVVSTIIAQNMNTNLAGTLGLGSSNNITSGNAVASTLAFHDGGTTQTFLPLKTGPAVHSDPGLNPDGLTTDQNGRPFHKSDIFIGSVQTTS